MEFLASQIPQQMIHGSSLNPFNSFLSNQFFKHSSIDLPFQTFLNTSEGFSLLPDLLSIRTVDQQMRKCFPLQFHITDRYLDPVYATFGCFPKSKPYFLKINTLKFWSSLEPSTSRFASITKQGLEDLRQTKICILAELCNNLPTYTPGYVSYLDPFRTCLGSVMNVYLEGIQYGSLWDLILIHMGQIPMWYHLPAHICRAQVRPFSQDQPF
jgi:hypothetical protein